MYAHDQSEAERLAAAEAEMKKYCAKHPRSPAARNRPRIFLRGSTCIALLGGTLDDGVSGVGATVNAALRAFDAQYRDRPKKPRRSL